MWNAAAREMSDLRMVVLRGLGLRMEMKCRCEFWGYTALVWVLVLGMDGRWKAFLSGRVRLWMVTVIEVKAEAEFKVWVWEFSEIHTQLKQHEYPSKVKSINLPRYFHNGWNSPPIDRSIPCILKIRIFTLCNTRILFLSLRVHYAVTSLLARSKAPQGAAR